MIQRHRVKDDQPVVVTPQSMKASLGHQKSTLIKSKRVRLHAPGQIQLCEEGHEEAAGHDSAGSDNSDQHRLGVPPGCHRPYLEAEHHRERRLHSQNRQLSAPDGQPYAVPKLATPS